MKLWFRAIWEVCVRRTGISAADLQRILGLGSYETAWVWLHRIRRAFVRVEREPLCRTVQLDEAFIGGKNMKKEVVLVAAEEGGRVRLTHAPGNYEAVIAHAVDTTVELHADIKSDGHAAYNKRTLGNRRHEAKAQTKAGKKAGAHVQACDWTIAGLKRWLLGTHHGAVSGKHLQSYLDEHAFRHNRRKTKGVGRLVARCLEMMVAQPPLPMHALIKQTKPCRHFESVPC